MRILEIRPYKKGKLLVLTDEVGTFPIYEAEASGLHLQEDGIITDEEWEHISRDILMKRAVRRAEYILAQTDRTESQLRRKLTEGHYPDEIIDAVISYMKSYRYIDDRRYAESYIRLNQDRKSRFQMRETLLSRGVDQELISEVMEDSYEGDEVEIIRRILDKQGYDPETSDPKTKQRIYRYLRSRGFPNSEIKRQMDLIGD